MPAGFFFLLKWLRFEIFHHRPASAAMLWSCLLAYGNGKKSLPSGNPVILWKAFLGFWFSFCLGRVHHQYCTREGACLEHDRHAIHRKGPLMGCFVAVGTSILIWVFTPLRMTWRDSWEHCTLVPIQRSRCTSWRCFLSLSPHSFSQVKTSPVPSSSYELSSRYYLRSQPWCPLSMVFITHPTLSICPMLWLVLKEVELYWMCGHLQKDLHRTHFFLIS